MLETKSGENRDAESDEFFHKATKRRLLDPVLTRKGSVAMNRAGRNSSCFEEKLHLFEKCLCGRRRFPGALFLFICTQSFKYYPEVETQILWPPNEKEELTGEEPNAGKD